MAEDKYLNTFKKNVGVVAYRLRALKYFSFRERSEDEELRNVQEVKKKEASLYVGNNIMKEKIGFNLGTCSDFELGTCSDFELEFMRRKMSGWLRIYNKVNPIKLSKTIQREQECLKEVEDEILRRKK